MYEEDEETKEVKMAEEQPAMDTDALKDGSNWAFRHPNIYSSGKCVLEPTPGLSEEEAAAEAEKQEGEKVERFKAIKGEEDAALDWIIRVSGDTQQYKDGDNNKTYAVNVLRSLKWPGAVTVAKGGAFSCIYVGDGLKKGEFSFNPTEPPEVMSDPLGQTEMPEPTPQEAPEDPPEPDTDGAAGNEEGEEEAD